jgi:hypothetical protein
MLKVVRCSFRSWLSTESYVEHPCILCNMPQKAQHTALPSLKIIKVCCATFCKQSFLNLLCVLSINYSEISLMAAVTPNIVWSRMN